MARPKKIVESAEAVESPDAVAPEVEEASPNVYRASKPCPKCGAPVKQPYLDLTGLYRCHCSDPKCGFWDSIVSFTADGAAKSWEQAGGPVRFE